MVKSNKESTKLVTVMEEVQVVKYVEIVQKKFQQILSFPNMRLHGISSRDTNLAILCSMLFSLKMNLSNTVTLKQ